MTTEFVGDEKFGVVIFRNQFNFDFDPILAIEEIASGLSDDACRWTRAQVGHSQEMLSYRKCFDWKPSDAFAKGLDQNLRFVEIYKTVKNVLINCVNQYCSWYGMSMGFMEVMNFIKYYEGGIFQSHSDDGDSYLASVSTIAYLNDDYTGGDLKFTFLRETIKPTYGDIIVFPSNFIYKHSSEPVSSGVKYCVVTMFDYDRYDFLKSTIRNSQQLPIERADW